jgi:cytohesin
LDEVKKQLDAGTDVNVREERGHNLGRAPLHYAAGEGHVTIIGYLISKGADANAQASTGYTPLHVAAGRGRASAVRTLLAAGANPNALDVRGGPLHAAVLQGHAKVVVLLLDAKADPNLRREHDGRTPLHMFGHIATFYPDHVSIIETLLKRGADPMAVDKQGKTPLEIAHLEAAQHILLLGGIPKQMDPFLLTARAAATHKKAPLEFLEQRGIPLDAVSRFGDNALHSAVGHGDSDGTEALEFLLSRGLDVHADSDRRGTPLHLAVESCNYKAVRILLAAGANPSFTARHGEAPLHAIFGNGFRNYTERNTCKLAVAALLDAGADVKIVNRDGRTPLHALAGVPGIRERILRAGADPRAKDARGRTPLHEARTDSAAAIQFLVEAGADPRARDRVGRTPLHEMINNGPDTVEALVKAGADPNAQDENGSTPLHIYAEEGAWADEPHTAVALVKAGARLDIRDRHGRTAAEAFVLSPWGKNAYPVNKYGKLLAVLRGEAGGG